MFTTDRLYLRGFEESDLDNLLALCNNAEVQRGTIASIAPRPPKYKRDLLKLVEDSALWFAILIRGTGAFGGYCSIQISEYKNRDGEFSIFMFPRYWGKGYSLETAMFTLGHAFSALGLQRVSLSVREGNAGARSLYTKLGFKEEGRKRRGNWAEGRWEDIIYMGMLEEEWNAARNKAAT